MAQQTATDDDAQLANELADLAIINSASASGGEIQVRFSCNGTPESFNSEMLSKGYAVAMIAPGSVTYKNITDF